MVDDHPPGEPPQLGPSDRSTRAMVEDHITLAVAGDVEEDLRHHYSPDVLLLSHEGVLRGHEGVRTLSRVLHAHAGEDAEFRIHAVYVEGTHAFERWSAHRDGQMILDGGDSFVVEDGLITVQTIFFTRVPRAS